jgi:hypothetical protein
MKGWLAGNRRRPFLLRCVLGMVRGFVGRQGVDRGREAALLIG